MPNNKFGIHINSENDLKDAKNLINSNGGDWGYVTIVITEKERDHDRWQKVFDQMRRDHIIPIVRIATTPLGNVWQKPNHAEINNWAGFLNSLNWVVQNRYVVILNEPNLDNEWEGRNSPEEYAKFLKEMSRKLKETNSDFFVLPAGLAPQKDGIKFLSDMLKSDPTVFDQIDGWTSHPYPAYSKTVYKQELELINKDLPVFITETGWSGKDFSEDEIGKNLISAYQNEWNDENIVAITPFVLNYPVTPFAEYSWQKPDGSFYKFYEDVKNIQKVKGEPKQIEKGEILFAAMQPLIITGGDFVGAILAKNTGQSIWSAHLNLLVQSQGNDLEIKNIFMNDIEPSRLGLIYFKIAKTNKEGFYKTELFLSEKNKVKISNQFKTEVFIVNLGKINFGSIFLKLLKSVNL